jgi:hypothetical protein
MNTPDIKNSVHVFLAHKGGVGKTTDGALLCEWLINQGAAPVVFDADAKNTDACISNYKALNARKLPLLRTDETGAERINEAGFEELLESALEEEGPHVIDTGANTYTHWLSYVIDLGLVDELKAAGKTVYLHTIIAGGEMTEETVKGLEELAAALPWPIVVWLNEYKSPAKLRGGVHFLESAPYVALSGRIEGIVRMKEVTPVQRDALDTLGALHLLVGEVRKDSGVSSQKRIAFGSWARDAFNGLDKVFQVGQAKAA